MKIEHLIDTLLTPSISALDWVGKYGGLVRTINYQTGGLDKGGPVKRYPVGCNVQGQDCNNLSVLSSLVPDDKKDSVVYWEELSPMSDRGKIKGRPLYWRKYEGTARLVVWMNLPRLGQTSCSTPLEAIAQLEAIIIQNLKLDSGVYEGAIVQIKPTRYPKKDINTIFGKYDYDKLIPWYLPPFDYFAIDVTFTMQHCVKKGGTLVANSPIDCVNQAPAAPPPMDNLILWLKADAGVNGGNPSDSDPVSIWEDQSGNNNNFIQGNFLNQPSYKLNGANGQPTISFTNPQYLERIASILFNNEASFYVVLKKNFNPTSGNLANVLTFSVVNFINPSGLFFILQEVVVFPGFPSNSYYLNFSNITLDGTLGTDDTNPHLLNFIKSTTQTERRRDGSTIGTLAGVQSIANISHFIGGWFSPGRTFEGEISEIMAYTNPLDTTNNALVEAYLKQKYAV